MLILVELTKAHQEVRIGPCSSVKNQMSWNFNRSCEVAKLSGDSSANVRTSSQQCEKRLIFDVFSPIHCQQAFMEMIVVSEGIFQAQINSVLVQLVKIDPGHFLWWCQKAREVQRRGGGVKRWRGWHGKEPACSILSKRSRAWSGILRRPSELGDRGGRWQRWRRSRERCHGSHMPVHSRDPSRLLRGS